MPPTVTVENCEHCPFRGQGSPHCVAREHGIPGKRPSRVAVESSCGWVSGKNKPPPKLCPLRTVDAVVVRIGGGK